MNKLEVIAGSLAIAAAVLVLAYEASSAERLTDAQLDGVHAAAKPVNGNAGPYTQQPVKGIPNVVKGKGASCKCGPGATVKK
jgi:hypothetical protein